MNTSERSKADEKNSRKDSASGCCGGPAPAGTSACCGEDAAIKSTGEGVWMRVSASTTRRRSVRAAASRADCKRRDECTRRNIATYAIKR